MKVVVSNIVLDRLILTVRVETKREENIFSVQQKKNKKRRKYLLCSAKKNEMVSNDMILGELLYPFKQALGFYLSTFNKLMAMACFQMPNF